MVDATSESSWKSRATRTSTLLELDASSRRDDEVCKSRRVPRLPTEEADSLSAFPRLAMTKSASALRPIREGGNKVGFLLMLLMLGIEQGSRW